MFTGIIQAKGTIEAATPQTGDLRLRIGTGRLDLTTVRVGDSIAVAGVCLTVTALHRQRVEADVSAETLRCTTLGALRPGDPVNLEKALTLATPLGGHLVSGHVDGVGDVSLCREDGRSRHYLIEAPAALTRYIAPKGSICVDGVSLTVNAVNGAAFAVNLVPHTLQETTLHGLGVGARVNLEVDLIARYAERLLQGDSTQRGGLTRGGLRRAGFIDD